MELQEERVEVEQHVGDEAHQQDQRQDRSGAQAVWHGVTIGRVLAEDDGEDDEHSANDERERENLRHQDAHIEHVFDLAGLKGWFAIGQFGLFQFDQACALRHDGIQPARRQRCALFQREAVDIGREAGAIVFELNEPRIRHDANAGDDEQKGDGEGDEDDENFSQHG